MSDQRKPGLPSLNESRDSRRKRAASGRVNLAGGIPPKVFGYGMLVLIVGGFIIFRQAQAELEDQRQGIMTKQRATAKVLGPKLIPLRDIVEKGALELAGEGKTFVDPSVDFSALFQKPGVYLRLRKQEANDVASLQEAAADSLRDGFTACLIQDPSAQPPTSGKACAESKECASGEYCNEFNHCQRPSSPFNMRMLYKSLLVLSEKWTKEVREAGTEYALTAYERGLDSVTQVDIPIAIDIYRRSKYAVIVLDEDPKGGLPKPLAGSFEKEAERVQRTEHYARIGVWDLGSGKLLARSRAYAAGELREAGSRKAEVSVESHAARSRTANSCGLALNFKAQVMNP